MVKPYPALILIELKSHKRLVRHQSVCWYAVAMITISAGEHSLLVHSAMLSSAVITPGTVERYLTLLVTATNGDSG